MADPTDIVIAVCRDESDIIESFIRFYLAQGFDRVCLVDNASRDDTVWRISRSLSDDRVCLHSDRRAGYDIRLFEYYERFVGLASRWVFFIDVDEFIPLPGGIKQFAASLPCEITVLAIHTAEMIPFPELPEGASPLLTTRREAELSTEKKVVWKAGVATQIYCGKHGIGGWPLVVCDDDRLLIRHFHSRSESQLCSKLQNRIETELAISRSQGRADALSMFSQGERAQWLEESRRLLESGGWRLELERFAAMPWIEDTVISEWYRTQTRVAPAARTYQP